MPKFDVVGKPMAAVGSQAIVTGKAVYSPDLELPNMLVAWIDASGASSLLYSPHASARILKIDVSLAREIPGVHAVITAENIPGENSYLYWYPDQPLLVSDQVRYQGDRR